MDKNYDVFVSYSSKDKTIADAIVHYFEERKIRCWIAPRDIDPGKLWESGIVSGIKSSRVCLLIFSANSNASEQVWREIGLAADFKLPIMPFRVEDVTQCEALIYYLKNIHWLDAINGELEDNIKNLYDSVVKLMPDRKVDPNPVHTKETAIGNTDENKNPLTPDSPKTVGTVTPMQGVDNNSGNTAVLQQPKNPDVAGNNSKANPIANFFKYLFKKPSRIIISLAVLIVAVVALVFIVRAFWGDKIGTNDLKASDNSGNAETNVTSSASNSQSFAVGNTVQFGAYDWLVLDVQDDKALIITKDCVALMKFVASDSPAYASYPYSGSNLRTYVDRDFYNSFSADEQSNIITTTITEYGSTLYDRIFLLSVDEAKEYFSSDTERAANYEGQPVIWWLRTNGTGNRLPGVGSAGVIGENGIPIIYDDACGVRPAMWIQIDGTDSNSQQTAASNKIFFTQELAKLSGNDDGLVYLINTPLYGLTKPHWDQFVFTKSGVVMWNSHYGVSPDSVSIMGGTIDSVSSGEYTIDNDTIKIVMKSENDDAWEANFSCRLTDDGNMEINGEYGYTDGRYGDTLSQYYGIIEYCGTYENRFFNPNDNFESVKSEIDKGGDAAETNTVETAVTTQQTASVSQGAVNEQGNTAGNINNNGLVAQQGDWIYYSNRNDGDNLYKMRTDGSEKTKLYGYGIAIHEYINVIGDWIYYGYGDYGNIKLYKIRADGSERTQISDDICSYVNAVGDWIYYTNGSDNNFLYKIRADGSERTKLNDEDSEYINVIDGWVYYSDAKSNICKIRTDGSGRTKLNDDNSISINVIDDWVYYCNRDDFGRLYKINTDGSGRIKVNDDWGTYYNIADGWIYFSNTSDGGPIESKLYRIRTDGSGRTKLSSDGGCSSINIIDGWVYYYNWSDNHKLYKIRTDGTEKQLVE
ncbi:MAG: DUF5050 domain-containing protein [Oscillospiraceae bacterium]|nr:DUF5050 domain-containing protein [Oscillospiraceae bacterium]